MGARPGRGRLASINAASRNRRLGQAVGSSSLTYVKIKIQASHAIPRCPRKCADSMDVREGLS